MHRPIQHDDTHAPARARVDVRSLAAVFAELAEVLSALDDAAYAGPPAGTVDGRIGGHVRHCLDHLTALIDGARGGRVDYEHRQRGTPVECDRAAAVDAIRDAIARLRGLRVAAARPVSVSVQVCVDGVPEAFASTWGREAAYVLSHSIHHHAMIAASVRALGGRVPPRFGYAPSTPAEPTRTTETTRKASPCAR